MQTSKSGKDYLSAILRDRATVITRAFFWKIFHASGDADIALKVGRYRKVKGRYDFEIPETNQPKSELTLDDEEFHKLVEFVQENYEPFKIGVRQYVPINSTFDQTSIEHLKAVFDNPEKQELLEFIIEHNIIHRDLVLGLVNRQRVKAIEQFEEMLDNNLVEHKWQKWFEENSWVLGTEFVRVLDEREIDTENIADFLVEAYDGFLDIVEIKRPEGDLNFWQDKKDHKNYVPSSDLVRAITQASSYIYEIEREANSVKFLERVDHVKTVKPRCILIFGRSYDWDNEKNESYRIQNSLYHNLSILTYDHVIDRAKRICGMVTGQKCL
ncbi:MAG: DUF4263 domain-containing protein [Syntrophus sp. (in: bacteria)]|nr:DUF4263 domain-containing protein [Syntrophus sp. (in: bacteria)]